MKRTGRVESVSQELSSPAGIPPVISVHAYVVLLHCPLYLGSAGAVTTQSVALKRPFSVPSLGRVDKPAVSHVEYTYKVVHCTCI